MGAARKLQAEIDRTLKKVQEGIDEFENIYDKVQSTENANQKEKFQSDLKQEIKKLQRHRDQIKTWISSADIKDKSTLLDARKAIESQMEKFKVCEKEAKTKAFSKAALGAVDKMDSKEQARTEAREWLTHTVDTLNTKISVLEFEFEELQNNNKKKAKPSARLQQVEDSMTKCKEHVVRLEQCLRCLDNEIISAEEVTEVKDVLDSLVNTDDGEDLMQEDMGYETTDDFYVDLIERLDGVDMHLPSASSANHGKHKHKEPKAGRNKLTLDSIPDNEDDSGSSVPPSPAMTLKDKEKEREKERAAAALVKAQLVAQGHTSVKLDDDDRKPPRGVNGVAPIPPLSPSTHASANHRTLPLGGGKDAVSDEHGPGRNGVTPSHPPSSRPPPITAPTPPLSPSSSIPQPPLTAEDSRQGITTSQQPGTSAPPPSLPSPSQHLRPGLPSPSAQAPGPVPMALLARPGPASWNAVAAAGAAALEDGADKKAADSLALQLGSTTLQDRGSVGGAAGVIAPASSLPSPQQQVAGSAPPGQVAAQIQQAQAQQQQQQAVGPSAKQPQPQQQQQAQQQQQQQQAQNLVQAQGGQQRLGEFQLGTQLPAVNTAAALAILEGCYSNRAIPQTGDSDWNTKRFKPRHPAALPPSYPRTQPEILDNPALFRKMDPEALFFAFYYQPDTYQQYLAAMELKRQSWRYHKQHNAWFQRYAEPNVTNDEYEQGQYVYFDYNIMHDDMQTGWCYRRKENFTFRYDALEDELQVQSV